MSDSVWKARAGLCVAGMAAYLTALVVTWPATWLDQNISAATAGTVRVVNASGTVWSGRGALEIRHQGKALGRPHPLSWQFQPAALAQAALGFSILIDGSPGPVPLRIGFTSMELRELSLSLPASTLALMADKLVALEPRGELLLRVENMVLGGKNPETNMRIEWLRAASGMTDLAPLGDYRIQCQMRDGNVSVTMETMKGPLHLEGRGSWPQGTPAVFMGKARIPAELQSRMAPMLRLIATERGAGEFDIQIR